MPTFRDLIAGDELIIAPVARNPIMARLAAESGIKPLSLGAASLGWYQVVAHAQS